MPYIGNTVQNQGFAPAIDYFSGNGVTVTFTLSRPVASVAQMIVAIDNVIQNPSSSFTVAGNSITFTSAPLSGTNNIWVEYTSLITTYAAISQDPTVIGDIRATGGYLAEGDFGNSYIDGTIVDYVTGNARITTGPIDNMTFYHGGTSARSEMMELYYAGGAKVFGTTALTIPVGTTAERPGTPAAGMIRYNSTSGNPEWWSPLYSSWVAFSSAGPYPVEYVVIAGGGGGGSAGASSGLSGGGGAGGYRSSVTGESSGGGASAESPLTLTPGVTYTVTIGAGGTAVTGNNRGNTGSNSVFGSITSLGGGGGSSGDSGIGASSGGSGGGGGNGGGSPVRTGAAGTSGQGFAGGNTTNNGQNYPASGGGGAGAAGSGNSSNLQAGAGGVGVASSITGSSVFRAGGGGGGINTVLGGGSPGAGGNGGGGAGGQNSFGVNGTVNTGGGGGGSGGDNATGGGAGGSGIVIIRYTGAQRGTGGTVTSSGGYTIHTFTTSGTYIA